MKVRSVSTAPGEGTASGLAARTSSPEVTAMPAFTFAAYDCGRSFSMTRTPSNGSAGALPETLATTTISSTCGTSAGNDSASSAACPCETTIAETLTALLP